MSRGRYVYEDPSIGAIISAVAVVDFILGEKRYGSYLKQTTGDPGDLSLVYKNAKVVLIEFKAPELVTCNTGKCWKYEIKQVNSSFFNSYIQLANNGLLFLGLIHGLFSPNRAPSNGKATFRYAPLTTAFVIPLDTGRCLDKLRNNKKQNKTLHVTGVYQRFYGFRFLNILCNIDFKYDIYRRDFVRCYLTTCRLGNSVCDSGVSILQTLECGSVRVVDLATLICCIKKCKFGKKGEEAKPLLKDVATFLQRTPHEDANPYVLISTMELIPLRDFIDLIDIAPSG